MAKSFLQSLRILYVLLVIYVIGVNGISAVLDDERKVYIVYMGSLPAGEYSPSTHHLSILEEVVDSRFVEQSLVRSYKRSFNGFAAKLTNREQQKIAGRDDVVLIFPSQKRHLHTTASWDFMNFSQNVSRNLNVETDIVIGVIDSGIWPESKSFDDTGLGPVPKKWKGACEGGTNFTCNKKLIGARNYVPGEDSARDVEGHGTHTASTAAGSIVRGATFFGIGNGTARGAVPSARIAAYRVCGESGCTDDGIMAAFDDAIADGVDILTLSLGSDSAADITSDTIAIGSFHALRKGILTVQSAGNNGDSPGRVSSIAPWSFSVAASSITRRFVAPINLGNGKTIYGNAINAFKLKGTRFPLVYGSKASSSCSATDAEQCVDGCLDRDLVRGKIVVCNTDDIQNAAIEVNRTGGVAAIFVEAERFSGVAFVTFYPYSLVTPQQLTQVISYINSTRFPTANLLTSVAIKDATAPKVATFSSRGPNLIFPDLLKPDITAPGVDILAAWSTVSSPSGAPLFDQRSVDYNIISGTSMSCPHVTGAAAYVKSVHPRWSPSAIKSALMTTAWKMNASSPNIATEAEFAYGAGHLNPTKAAHPGLVYETLESDYLNWICGLNTAREVLKVYGFNVTCKGVVPIETKDLNYPSLSAQVQSDRSFKVTFSRNVTNVGMPNATYKAKITKNSRGLDVTVVPNTLFFKATHETKSFVVTVTGEELRVFASADLEWSDGLHNVRSPIFVYGNE
ncbi:OLC1v1028033C1 [Oldenlandia corymbosa var. corymbosa]|uniref:OLC1v1028033C1 n=1 Tax=Oldenlandia corymbosa var. corymbosa TaxID=529605 RepID=A0AAV1CCU4_OLDCO|nr:OLC1v1028033C1 [Oldenlandia corymbosa var. corymbosa]